MYQTQRDRKTQRQRQETVRGVSERENLKEREKTDRESPTVEGQREGQKGRQNNRVKERQRDCVFQVVLANHPLSWPQCIHLHCISFLQQCSAMPVQHAAQAHTLAQTHAHTHSTKLVLAAH